MAIHDGSGALRAAAGPGAEVFARLLASALPEGQSALPLGTGAHVIRRTSNHDGEPLAYLLVGPYRLSVVSADDIDNDDMARPACRTR